MTYVGLWLIFWVVGTSLCGFTHETCNCAQSFCLSSITVYKKFRSRSMLLLYGMDNYYGEGHHTASIARKQNIQRHMNTKKPECCSANIMSLFECRLSNNNIIK